MVSSDMTAPVTQEGLDELLRPEPLADGSRPEQRVVYTAISWSRYLALDQKLGDDRPGLRLQYLDSDKLQLYRRFTMREARSWHRDELEIFTLSNAGACVSSPTSPLLLAVKIPLIDGCVAMRSWQQTHQAFLAGPANG